MFIPSQVLGPSRTILSMSKWFNWLTFIQLLVFTSYVPVRENLCFPFYSWLIKTYIHPQMLRRESYFKYLLSFLKFI